MNCSTKQLSAEFLGRPFLGAKCLTVVLLTCFITSGPLPCFGQTFTASLSGVVSDPQGAVIPNASIELKNSNTNEIRRTTTGGDGSYALSNLLPGTYELTVKAQGFKAFVQRNIILQASRSSELNVSLQLGELAQTVEVTEAAVLLDTKSANDLATLNRTLVAELPTNTRTPLNFVFALAGTTEGPSGMTSPSHNIDQMFNTFGLHGGRSGSSQVLLDGAPATAVDWGGLMVSPTVDAVQEMQVLRNTYETQYGRAGGGIITLISKGGSPEFHGTVYEFLRNDNLDANDWGTNRAGAKKGEFKRHQFGGNVGGPIWKSKNLFFFAGFEGLRQPFVTGSGFRTLPTDLERQGDFSRSYNPDGTLRVIFDPFTTQPDPANPGQFIRDPFDASCIGVVAPATCPGNKIPASLIDPVGAKVVALYPSPNRAGEGLAQINNFFKQGSGGQVNEKIEARIDWAKSEKHRMFGRWSQRVRQTSKTACFYCNGADTEHSQKNPGFAVTLDNTFLPNPSWVISVLLGASYWVEDQFSASLGVIDAGDLGLDPSQFHAPLIPSFGVGEYAGLGNPKIRKFPRAAHSLQVNSTKETGSHTFKFGWMGQSDLMNNVDRFSAFLNFGRGMTSGPVAAQDSSTTGHSIASLLLGTGAGGSAPFNPDKALSLRYYGFYFQDNWRVNTRLTLNLGLRYDIQPGATERFNRLSRFNLDATNPLGARVGLPLKGGFEYVSSSDRRAWPTDKSDWAPRVGFAYKITDKLVMRGGAGIFFVPASAMISFDDPGHFMGFSTETSWVASVGGGGLIPEDLLRNPFPQGKNQPTGSAAGLETALGEYLFQVWPTGDHSTGYKQHFSLDFQYELAPGSVAEVGYSGFRGRKLMFGDPGLNANQLHPSLLSRTDLDVLVPNPFFGQITSGFLSGPTVPQHRLLRPFPHFDGINWTRSYPGATNNFDALTAKFTRQFRGGLTVLSTYQWSKNLDNGSEDMIGWALGNEWRDYHNRKAEYAVSSHDLPHSFVTAFVYELPFGRGKKFGANMPAVANQIAGGWQLSGVVRFASGLPIPLFSQYHPNPNGAYGYGIAALNMVGDPKLDNQTADRWFNTDAFALPTGNAIGNAPRYHGRVREEGAKNVDFGIAKSFKAEAFKIQFRTEFLNLFNSPQFGGGNQWWSNIQNCFACGAYGQVHGTRNLPRNIQLALKVDF